MVGSHPVIPSTDHSHSILFLVVVDFCFYWGRSDQFPARDSVMQFKRSLFIFKSKTYESPNRVWSIMDHGRGGLAWRRYVFVPVRIMSLTYIRTLDTKTRPCQPLIRDKFSKLLLYFKLNSDWGNVTLGIVVRSTGQRNAQYTVRGLHGDLSRWSLLVTRNPSWHFDILAGCC